MSVQMFDFSMFKSKRKEEIRGNFYLKYYNYIVVEYVIEGEEISFSHKYLDEKMNDSFEEWYSYEKETYKTFIFNFLNEIKKFDTIPSSEGHLVEEHSTIFSGKPEYVSTVKYQQISSPVQFVFYPGSEEMKLLYEVPIPINSEGRYANKIFIQNILKKETIQQMWEPFRDKTKYRLQLLHELR